MKIAYRWILVQIGVVGIVALVWLSSGWTAAVSAVLGGVAAVAPNFYFAHRFFAATYARQVWRIIRTFYWGELTKLLLSAALVILFAKLWPNMVMLPFFSSFAAAYLGFGLAPFVIRPKS